ncbi:tumor necrosis factor receptor superfamily member 12A isoform X3 [Denticeps clupeoides]|uniref:tumor necrosis factor receptor superfamily member 12A isoform X3 n=1 Tax=Denticeps clupeoides TaxID=299321 RepID=UPI0010A54E4F|nr:tumor necrosis factor receptor superfamily member 12A-like isoform X3 [Denticeps clupeoides]
MAATLCALGGLLLLLLLAASVADAQKGLCKATETWNPDVDECLPCAMCVTYTKTPGCDKCPGPAAQGLSDAWRLAAITSFSVLAAVLVFGGLLVGVLVHQCRTRRSTLREPIEETTGPLYPV